MFYKKLIINILYFFFFFFPLSLSLKAQNVDYEKLSLNELEKVLPIFMTILLVKKYAIYLLEKQKKKIILKHCLELINLLLFLLKTLKILNMQIVL
jgi:hypothetical protein